MREIKGDQCFEERGSGLGGGGGGGSNEDNASDVRDTNNKKPKIF